VYLKLIILIFLRLRKEVDIKQVWTSQVVSLVNLAKRKQ